MAVLNNARFAKEPKRKGNDDYQMNSSFVMNSLDSILV